MNFKMGALAILAKIYRKLGDNNKAISFYESAIEAGRETKDKAGLAMIHSNFAIALFYQKRQNEALRHAQHAVDVFIQEGFLDEAVKAKIVVKQIRENIN